MCQYSLEIEESDGVLFPSHQAKGRSYGCHLATARKIAEIFYIMVRDKIAYDEGKVGLDEEALFKRKIERTQRVLNALNAKLYAKAS